MRLIIVALLVFASSAALGASEGASTYNIRLTSVPPLKVGLTTSVAAQRSSLYTTGGTAHVDFNIYESSATDAAQWKWIYTFNNVGIGDEIVLQGVIYRVDAIKSTDVAVQTDVPEVTYPSTEFRPRVELSGGCGQHCGDFVRIVSTGTNISSSKNESIVLSSAATSVATFFQGTAEFQMKLESLKRDLSGKYEASLKWRRGDQLRDIGGIRYGIRWSSSWTNVMVHSGDSIYLPGVGHLRVGSILPSERGRTDWVVVVTGNQ